MVRPHPIAWLRTHPQTSDLLLTIAVTVIGLVAHIFGEPANGDPDLVDPTWWSIVLTLVGCVAIYWRRHHPIGVAIVVVAVQVVGLLVDVDGAVFFPATIAVYSLGAYSTGLRRTGALITITVLLIVLFTLGWVEGQPLLDEFVSTMIVLTTALVIGDNMRRRREHLDDLTDRAERAEREQELLAEQRVGAERTRIARELHDVVAHSVSLMVIQAGAARRSIAAHHDSAEAALSNIEATGRQTMLELRTILGVLRTDDPVDGPILDPNPSLTDISSVIVADDLPISFTVSGRIDDVVGGVGLTGYRIVQEALTNVRRHAGAVTAVEVVIARSTTILSITVTDDGRGAAADHPFGNGYGIVGMRERAASVGGSLISGPRPGGGWHVTAILPVAQSNEHGADDRAADDRATDDRATDDCAADLADRALIVDASA